VIVFFLDPEDLQGGLEMRLRERVRSGARLITVNCPLQGWQPSQKKEIAFSDSEYTIRLYNQKGRAHG
jgi:hypothetical protein